MVWIPKSLADTGRRLNKAYYGQLLRSRYRGRTAPSWFDHRIDLYYNWPHNSFWLERAILPRKHMTTGCAVLDLFSGDGYYSAHFHATIAGHIDAVDKDPSAIAHARRYHAHKAIQYYVLDAVEQDFPRSAYDVVLWFEGIEHLSDKEYLKIIGKIKNCIRGGGVLVGSTPLVPEDKLGQNNWEHQNEFTTVDQLRSFLSRDFAEVIIDVTTWPLRQGGERKTAHFTVKAPTV